MKIEIGKLLEELERPERPEKKRVSINLTEANWVRFQEIVGDGNASKMVDRLLEEFAAAYEADKAKK